MPGEEPVAEVGADALVGGLAFGVELDGAVGFAGVEVEGEVFDDGYGVRIDADEDVGAGSERGARCVCRFERDVFADAAIGAEVFEVVAGEGAADRLVVFADDPVFAVDVEGVDDVALAGADAGGAALAGTAEDGALAVELLPAAEGGFDDDEVLVGDPELWLRGDYGAVLELGGLVLVEAKFGVADAFFGVDVAGMGFQVGGEEFFRLLIVLVVKGLAGGGEVQGGWASAPRQVAMSAKRMMAAVGCVLCVSVHVLSAPSLPHCASADEASEDCDRGQEGDPE